MYKSWVIWQRWPWFQSYSPTALNWKSESWGKSTSYIILQPLSARPLCLQVGSSFPSWLIFQSQCRRFIRIEHSSEIWAHVDTTASQRWESPVPPHREGAQKGCELLTLPLLIPGRMDPCFPVFPPNSFECEADMETRQSGNIFTGFYVSFLL